MSFGEILIHRELGLNQTFDFFVQTMNKRLKTNGLSISEVYMEAQKRGLSFTDLVIMPEQDEWIFMDDNGQQGPSMVCDVLVSKIWKAAGLFGDIVDQIQATEFTNWDAYSLKFFDENYKRPPQCVKADPHLPFCQILGKYRITLPGYNSVVPFAHMREKCPGIAPDYKKPANC